MTSILSHSNLVPRLVSQSGCRSLFTSTNLLSYHKDMEKNLDPFPIPKRWPLKNEIMYQPQAPDEPKRRALYYHVRDNIRYSPKKMWYICCLIRGLNIDEAYKQLAFVPKKGAAITREVLEEAQEAAMATGCFEYKSNMWLGDVFATKGLVIRGIRKMIRRQEPGDVRRFHSHLFLTLVEGPPQKHFYWPHDLTNQEKLDYYIEGLRKRRIQNSL